MAADGKFPHLTQEELRSFLQSVPGCVWIAESEPAFNFSYTSATFEALTGYGADRFNHNVAAWLALILPEDRAAIALAYDRQRIEAEDKVLSYRLRARDGTTRMVVDSILFVSKQPGANRVFGRMEDVTERVNLERGLHEISAKYSQLYHEAPVMMHSIDRQGRILSVSDYWLQKLGYTTEEVVGRPILEFYTPESRRYAHEVALPRFFRTGEARDIPYQLLRKDGEPIDILLSAVGITDAVGQIEQALAVVTDVTDWKRAEQLRHELLIREKEARTEAENARELDRLRRQFINAVTHELRTPLTSIQGYAEFLEDGIGGQLTPQQLEFAAQIQQGATRLTRLVDDLLDLARMEAGTFGLQVRQADLKAKVSEIANSLRPQMNAAGIDLEIQLPGRPLFLLMDPDRIGQVLLNLLSNAIKFTSPGGRVRIIAERRNDGVMCEVQDTGVGVAQQDIPKLFQRFGQLEEGRGKAKGTGLGLFISKAIVEAHQGKIGVRSEHQNGSVFWFWLP